MVSWLRCDVASWSPVSWFGWDGLHNPGLTRLAVLLIHGRPRSLLAVSLIAPSSPWRRFISNWPHTQTQTT
uniref:Uncharacterized protein n=1 Tax=Oryza brachyantha TaxID=4533 RepID=J3KX82_ORYBR